MTRPKQAKSKAKQPGRPPRRLTFEELPQVPTVKQVANFLGKHETTVYEWIARGEFPPAVRTKGRKVISKAKLAEWLGIPYQMGQLGQPGQRQGGGADGQTATEEHRTQVHA